MSDDKGYNGWTNYETWNLALWIGNEEGSHSYWEQDRAREAYTDAKDGAECNLPDVAKYREERVHAAACELADSLKADTEENAPELTGCYADLLNAALSEINYYEIAKSWIEDIADEVEEEEKAEAE